jgi:hypothetical protein
MGVRFMRRVFVLGFVLTILMTAGAYANENGITYGVITGSRVNVRSEAEIDANTRLFQVERGTAVEILGVSGDFFNVNIMGTDDVFVAREFVRITQVTGAVTTPHAWVYDIPAEEGGTAVGVVLLDRPVTVVSVYGDWFGIEKDDSVAFVKQSDVLVPYFAELPLARIGNTLADSIIDTAMNYLGTRYLWGGSSPNGFDCSGFMRYVFSSHGIELSRSSRDQARNGIAVARDDLERGDLVFFGNGGGINHAGLYIGNDEFIHSSSDRSGGVIVSSMNETHNLRGYITARRVL